MWSLELKAQADSLSEAIEQLLEDWPPNLLPVSEIEGVESGRLLIWFDTSNQGDVFEISIDSEDVRRLANFEIQLYMTVFPKIEDEC
jgi:hypothetical protein